MKLDHEEYVEQAYLFGLLAERLPRNAPLQELLEQARDEVLATTRLPLALDFLLAEIKHRGVVGPAMRQLRHYFAPFQAYLVEESESERGRFDIRVAVNVLQSEAKYRSEDAGCAGLFLFQFETLCRNRLSYDRGLTAAAEDPWYDDDWRSWILGVRRSVGLVDLADLLFVRSQHAVTRRAARGRVGSEDEPAMLFGEKEGKIAFANRRKDPLYLFAALQRHLGYPQVPRPRPSQDVGEQLPQILRRLERMETRLKLLEEDQQGGFDLSKFYEK